MRKPAHGTTKSGECLFSSVTIWLMAIIIQTFLPLSSYSSTVENTLFIDFSKDLGQINRKVFGNNIIAYDPKANETNYSAEYYGYSDYGAGIWDPIHKESVKEVIDLAKEAGITMLRFPGGCGTHHYDWKHAIGKEREHFLYGIDEFIKTCEEIGAEAVITVSFFTGDEQDAADLVEYLNGKAEEAEGSRLQGQGEEREGEGEEIKDMGSRSKGDGQKKINWADERVKNGHLKPYGVKYFEIGNEVYHGDHRGIEKVLPEEYAQRYLKYYDEMKTVDSSIKIGAVLHTTEWNNKVLGILKDKLDFGIIHTYPSPQVNNEQLEKMSEKEIFSLTLAIPVFRDEYFFQETLKLLKEKSGRDIPLAITEYNGGFVQDKPVPYRHCLGTALLNAELLRIFMNPENDVLVANYWQFCNSYWGMVRSKDDFMKPSYLNYRIPINYYIKRPNYYVYELYHKHFGDKLLQAEVKCDSYDTKELTHHINNITNLLRDGEIISENLLANKWAIKELKGVFVNEEDGVLKIHFYNPMQYNYFHTSKRVTIKPNSFYKVSGYIKTDNIIDSNGDGVCLEIQDSRGWIATHSAVSTEAFKGTQDWSYIESIYQTLPDAREINVIARRVGETGPLQGKAFFKNVKLNKYKPNTDIPYLSVNASTNTDENRVFLIVINKNMDESITSTIQLKGFLPSSKGDAWILNGTSIDATNEDNPDNVTVKHVEFGVESRELGVGGRESGVGSRELEANNLEPGAKNDFTFTFEPHSLTAIEIERKRECGVGRGELGGTLHP